MRSISAAGAAGGGLALAPPPGSRAGRLWGKPRELLEAPLLFYMQRALHRPAPPGAHGCFLGITSCQNRCESAARKRQLKELARKAKEKREQEAEPAAAAPGATREGRRQRIQPPSKADAQQPRARRPHEQQITCASV